MKRTKFHIEEYSAFAVCFLLLQTESSAEAVYSDIIPDTLIDFDWETFGIDMNNDGVVDFALLKRSFSFLETTYWSSYITSHLCIFYAGPQVFGNMIAGKRVILSPSYGGFTVYHPYALAEDVLINEDLDFQFAGYQELAYVYRGEYSSYADNGGNWFPEVLDHYLGIYFKDTMNCYHYGWIRLDVKDSGRELVIKDFAYETECDHPIVAGDTISYVDVEDENKLDAVVYSFENTIYINVSELQKLEIDIYDLTGRLIYSKIMTDRIFSIKLNQPTGYYIINLSSDSKKYSKKIFID
ncbi:MAG: T9SS type A sorting domain-containing protein [Chitinophagales bacterium]|nr:T9SS type A sorting domain-containing protein [Chitinophagales bacterium]MBP9220632.1 T9SS type A sorting domain-containing protein [Chitinophagales bacterium]MBP9794733.1 T9SS type A sorting domain-containing protein [Chitinophagales bacterium]